ncbi:SsrA-binding protein SmpB [Candidatus Uhrbacteria bacterium]|nr:SsrA-binding protein SmpB [Candidatus Uhrbacteria bacterium]
MNDLATNKNASYDYEILERFEAGLILFGHEVKSAKGGGASLKGSYVIIRGNKASLIGSHIARWKPAGVIPGYDPERSRELLLRKKELKYLLGKTAEKGLTAVPLRMYTKSGKIKLEFALARHKKKYEKREKIKEREVKRIIGSAVRRT